MSELVDRCLSCIIAQNIITSVSRLRSHELHCPICQKWYAEKEEQKANIEELKKHVGVVLT